MAFRKLNNHPSMWAPNDPYRNILRIRQAPQQGNLHGRDRSVLIYLECGHVLKPISRHIPKGKARCPECGIIQQKIAAGEMPDPKALPRPYNDGRPSQPFASGHFDDPLARKLNPVYLNEDKPTEVLVAPPPASNVLDSRGSLLPLVGGIESQQKIRPMADLEQVFDGPKRVEATVIKKPEPVSVSKTSYSNAYNVKEFLNDLHGKSKNNAASNPKQDTQVNITRKPRVVVLFKDRMRVAKWLMANEAELVKHQPSVEVVRDRINNDLGMQVSGRAVRKIAEESESGWSGAGVRTIDATKKAGTQLVYRHGLGVCARAILGLYDEMGASTDNLHDLKKLAEISTR